MKDNPNPDYLKSQEIKEDIVKDAIQQKKIETSINNITKITYQIKEKGVYALYNPANKEAIVFTIE